MRRCIQLLHLTAHSALLHFISFISFFSSNYGFSSESILNFCSIVVQHFTFPQVGPNGFNKTFSKWLDNKNYRDMIAEGKGKLEWDRKVPDEKIANLKELLNCETFNENLPDVSTLFGRCPKFGSFFF